ncbi:MAG: hypothetical protein AB1589_46305, partial [Cyanobacteriota bacterium]
NQKNGKRKDEMSDTRRKPEFNNGFVTALALFNSAEEGDKLFERCRQLLQEIDRKCFGLSVSVNYG